ncbi:uncharacterized protein ABDE67_019658 [Symphorus nematophorus]
METGQPVMRPGGSIVLQLDNDDGLQGWNCWVYRKTQEKTKRIKLKLKSNTVSLPFQRSLDDPETIFWCTDSTKEQRSDQITVRISDKDVSLEAYPLPAVAGESLTLRCLTWGTDQIRHTVFYKDNNIVQEAVDPIYKINDVAESVMGKYKCNATFTYKGHTSGPPYQLVSDDQDVFVQAAPIKPIVYVNTGMSCSCLPCPGGASYDWYMLDGRQPSKLPVSGQSMTPTQSGSYACRAKWATGRSLLSDRCRYESPSNKIVVIVVIVVIALVLLGTAIVAALYIRNKKRNATGAIYEDVRTGSRDKGDDKYEMLQRPPGAQGEREYDTLHPEASGSAKKEGEYEPLKKGEMKDGVYHTLGMEGAAGGEGGYEALKKEGMKEGVYHTLGMEGAAGGEGGYEALKKEGMKEGVYHTLGMEGAAGGEGGYEALKKEGMKEGVYHTLGMEGAGGGEEQKETGGKD